MIQILKSGECYLIIITQWELWPWKKSTEEWNFVGFKGGERVTSQGMWAAYNRKKIQRSRFQGYQTNRLVRTLVEDQWNPCGTAELWNLIYYICIDQVIKIVVICYNGRLIQL
jgi:hypothetical protein